MAKTKFSASLHQFSLSQDTSEIILICCFAAQETFLIIINVELLNIFVDCFCFDEYKVFEIINVFTVTFDQFNESLLN